VTHSHSDLASLGGELLRARNACQHAPRPSASGWELTVDDAYAAQAEQVRLMTSSGGKVAAIKLGLTDQAQQDRAGWSAPSFGALTESMLIAAGGELSLSCGIRPRVEPEIVVTLSRDVTSAPESVDEFIGYVADVRLGIEVVDPRYNDSEFILTDALADNSSALAGIVAETGVTADAIDWGNEELTLGVNGEKRVGGSGSALKGGPLGIALDAVRERLRLGLDVPKGLHIFTGNVAGKASAVQVGDVVDVSSPLMQPVTLQVVA
jgi:2-oxo-3-hexenedioate decarboxylase